MFAIIPVQILFWFLLLRWTDMLIRIWNWKKYLFTDKTLQLILKQIVRFYASRHKIFHIWPLVHRGAASEVNFLLFLAFPFRLICLVFQIRSGSKHRASEFHQQEPYRRESERRYHQQMEYSFVQQFVSSTVQSQTFRRIIASFGRKTISRSDVQPHFSAHGEESGPLCYSAGFV